MGRLSLDYEMHDTLLEEELNVVALPVGNDDDVSVNGNDHSLDGDYNGGHGGLTLLRSSLDRCCEFCGGFESCECDSKLKASKSANERKVSFDRVQLREYERILGDHPCALNGPPIGIGWKYNKRPSYLVDDYEGIKNRRRRESELRHEEEGDEDESGVENCGDGDVAESASDGDCDGYTSSESGDNSINRISKRRRENSRRERKIRENLISSREKSSDLKPIEGFVRRNMVRYDLGYSEKEIDSVLKEVGKIQQQRLRSLKSIQRVNSKQTTNAFEHLLHQKVVKYVSLYFGSTGDEKDDHQQNQQKNQQQQRERSALSRIFRGAVQAVVFAMTTFGQAKASMEETTPEEKENISNEIDQGADLEKHNEEEEHSNGNEVVQEVEREMNIEKEEEEQLSSQSSDMV